VVIDIAGGFFSVNLLMGRLLDTMKTLC
jgi:hypothetical protein